MKVSFYKKYVTKDLAKVHPRDQTIFKGFIEFIKGTKPPIVDSHVTPLKGYPNLFRYKKKGKKIRIIFFMKDESVLIIGVGYRKEVYNTVLKRI